jgi:hypothetical protein
MNRFRYPKDAFTFFKGEVVAGQAMALYRMSSTSEYFK